MDVFDFELQHRVHAGVADGQGSILQSIGTFITHNIHDILGDLELAAEHPIPHRSSSCPRGRSTQPPCKPSLQQLQQQQQQRQRQAEQPSDNPWRWESPPRRQLEHRQAALSLTASPESPSAPRRNVLLDVVSNLGQQATAFLDRLDHNFEQIFKAEDHDATTDVTTAARSQTQAAAAAAAAAGVPGAAGARSFALAGKQAGGVKGGKLGTMKGKLGANRLSAASSTRPATGTGEAANMSHGVQRAPAAAAPTTQGKPPCEAGADGTAAAAAAQGAVAAAPQVVLPLLIGGDAEVIITPKGAAAGLCLTKASVPQLCAVEQPTSPPSRRPATQAPELGALSPAASSLSQSSCRGLPGGEEPQQGAEGGQQGVEGGQRSAAGTPSSTASGTAAAAAGGSRALTAADKKRCLKALWQELTTLKAERQVMEGQLQELAGLRQERQELQAQVARLTCQNSQLLEENSRLQLEGHSHAIDPLAQEAVRQQMSLLLLDKAKLAEENQRLFRENDSLHALLALTTEHSQLVDSSSEWPSPSSCLPHPMLELGQGFDFGGHTTPMLECLRGATPFQQRSTQEELSLLREQYDELLSSSLQTWSSHDVVPSTMC